MIQNHSYTATDIPRCTCNETVAVPCRAIWHVPSRKQEANPPRNRHERRRQTKIRRRDV